MLEFSDVAVAHAIQPAVASVFSSFRHRAILAVMTHRLGRIIGAMLTFFLGLVWFLREIYVATVSAHRRSLSRSALNIWVIAAVCHSEALQSI